MSHTPMHPMTAAVLWALLQELGRKSRLYPEERFTFRIWPSANGYAAPIGMREFREGRYPETAVVENGYFWYQGYELDKYSLTPTQHWNGKETDRDWHALHLLVGRVRAHGGILPLVRDEIPEGFEYTWGKFLPKNGRSVDDTSPIQVTIENEEEMRGVIMMFLAFIQHHGSRVWMRENEQPISVMGVDRPQKSGGRMLNTDTGDVLTFTQAWRLMADRFSAYQFEEYLLRPANQHIGSVNRTGNLGFGHVPSFEVTFNLWGNDS